MLDDGVENNDVDFVRVLPIVSSDEANFPFEWES